MLALYRLYSLSLSLDRSLAMSPAFGRNRADIKLHAPESSHSVVYISIFLAMRWCKVAQSAGKKMGTGEKREKRHVLSEEEETRQTECNARVTKEIKNATRT